MDTRELPTLAEEDDNTEKFGEATQALFKVTPLQEPTTDWGRWSRPAPPGAVSRRKVPLWRFAWREIRHNPGRLGAILLVAAAAGVWTYNIYTTHTFEMRLETPGSTTQVTVTAPATPRTTTRPLHRGTPQPVQTRSHPATSGTTQPKTSATPAPTHGHTSDPTPTKTSVPPVQSKSPDPRPTPTETATTKSATATSSCTSTSGSPCPS